MVSAPALSPAELAKELSAATTRLVDLLRAIDQAQSRDDIVGAMARNLAQTHQRAGFLAVRGGELVPFVMYTSPTADGVMGTAPFIKTAALSTTVPSTFHDVIDTQLPFRGPLHDDASRQFLTSVFGSAPAEVLLVPMVLRDRVVGLLYADGRHRYTFDDHDAISARAAGIALERIVKARKA